MSRADELERKISILTKQGVPDSVIQKYRKELEKLKGASEAEQNTKQEEVAQSMSPGGQFTDSGFVIDTTPEEWEASDSKYPSRTGLLLSEAQMPDWKTPGVSLDFPFTIIESGPDEGKEGHIYTSLKKFSLQPVLNAMGVKLEFTPDGKPKFNHLEVPGKQFLSHWVMKKDERSAAEGGTGKTFPYCAGAYPIGTKEEDLGL